MQLPKLNCPLSNVPCALSKTCAFELFIWFPNKRESVKVIPNHQFQFGLSLAILQWTEIQHSTFPGGDLGGLICGWNLGTGTTDKMIYKKIFNYFILVFMTSMGLDRFCICPDCQLELALGLNQCGTIFNYVSLEQYQCHPLHSSLPINLHLHLQIWLLLISALYTQLHEMWLLDLFS